MAAPDPVEMVGACTRVEYMPLSELKRANRNPKKHLLVDLRKSMSRFGYTEPVVLDERTGHLVAGHGRLEALQAMHAEGGKPPKGVTAEGDAWLVPVMRGWASENDTEAEAYLLASNQLTIGGGWDDAGLSDILTKLSDMDGGLDGLGFSQEDLTKLLGETGVEVLPDGPVPGEDDAPEVPTETYVKPGDVYALGKHRIICGDCRSFEDVKRLLDGARINVAVTSPPYASQRTYDETSGFKPIPPDEYVEWYRDVAANIMANLADDGSYFCNIKEHCEDGQRSLYVKDLTLAHVRAWGWKFIDEFCWKRQGFPGGYVGRFKNEWEPVFHFGAKAGGELKFRPPKSDYAYDPSRQMTMGEKGSVGGGLSGDVARPGNVLDIGNSGTAGHSAAYPVALPEFFIKAFSDPGDAIFDPFMGSGTTLIAAEKQKRIAYGTEISPRYVQVIVERWEKFTNQKAVKVQ